MKLVIFVTLVALNAAAQLPSKDYLPPGQGSPANQGGFGGAGSYNNAGVGGAGSYNNAGAGGADGNGNTRAQQAVEKNAEVLKLDQEVGEEGFHYTYETSNGIRAEEGGNAEQTQGGFAYKDDDGITYTVTFTAGVGGFQPQGAHLPTPPPTPQEILLALAQNAKDEAAGIFDDGIYRPDAEQGTGGRPGSGGAGGSSQGFGSANRQGSFNANSGYNY